MAPNPRQHVPLDRFWQNLNADADVATSGGWLDDPLATWMGRSLNPTAHPSASFASLRCVVLLGEIGMGKTHAISDLAASEATELGVDRSIFIDLAQCTSELLLREALAKPDVQAWLDDSESHAVLYLDSFDEARVHVPSIANHLTASLESWPTERLTFRLASRAAEWAASLSADLDRIFDGVNEYLLLPLRRSDAALLAPPNVDGSKLLDLVDAAGLGALASRPLTLRLISGSFERDGRLPENITEIYQRGLLSMCEESDPRRRDNTALLSSKITASEQVDLAGAIAAVQIYGGLGSIWSGTESSTPPGSVTLTTLAALETDHANLSATFNDTVRSGIFSHAAGPGINWSHASFGDFLAARWTIKADLGEAQIRQLFIAEDGLIFPQLHHVVAWLVALDSNGFGWLVDADPEAFLLGIDIPSAALRKSIVGGLLSLADEGDLVNRHVRTYGGLFHPELDRQLNAVLDEPSRAAVRVAIDIARQCKVQAVVPALVRLGLSDACPRPTRVSAMMAVNDIEAGRQQPHGFEAILGETQVDVNSDASIDELELAGAALICTWPSLIPTDQALRYILPGHPKSFYGLYASFISDVARGLRDPDLESALDWAARHIHHLDDQRLRPLTDAVAMLAAQNLSSLRARGFVVDWVRQRVKSYEPIFDELSPPPALGIRDRRDLAYALLKAGDAHMAVAVVDRAGSAAFSLLGPDDLSWLISILPVVGSHLRDQIAIALRLLFNVGRRDHIDLLLELDDLHPARDALPFWLESVPVDSPLADELRAQSLGSSKFELRQREREEKSAWVNPKIAQLASDAVQGDLEAFWVACRHVYMRPASTAPQEEFQPDLTATPRWPTLQDEAQKDLLTAATRYVREGRCQPERWLGTDRGLYSAQAGYRALILLLRLDPQALNVVPSAAWQEWAPIIVQWMCTANGATWEDKRDLLLRAKPHAEAELEAALLAVLADTDLTGTFLYSNESVFLWSPSVEAAVEDLLKTPDLSSTAREQILGTLIDGGGEKARAALLQWVDRPARQVDRLRGVQAAQRLLHTDPSFIWPMMEKLLLDEPDFSREVFLTLGMHRLVPDLPAAALATLYLWLLHNFPPDEDPTFDDAHIVGDREQLGQWRDAIVASLAEEPRNGSVTALQRIIAEAPEIDWLRHYLPVARRSQRTAEWSATTALELLALKDTSEARLIRNSHELFESTLRALGAIQGRLRGDTPESPALWDVKSKQPKGEEFISDYLRNRMQDLLSPLGAIVNREVQVTRPPKGLGERTDLRIDAITKVGMTTAPVTVVGEVKGCWYRDLVEMLETQLVDRYMSPIGADYGIYIIVWFDTGQWSATDAPRRRIAAQRSPASIDLSLKPTLERLKVRGVTVRVIHLDASL